jgi:hypothetical protein
MHTTLELVGNPDDQSVETAFQLVVPDVGPCLLSVQVAAALGVAATTATAPAEPNDARAMAVAIPTLRIPRMSAPRP